ncbi:317_t:CDS:2, partial [Funneliformis geosporum]
FGNLFSRVEAIDWDPSDLRIDRVSSYPRSELPVETSPLLICYTGATWLLSVYVMRCKVNSTNKRSFSDQ